MIDLAKISFSLYYMSGIRRETASGSAAGAAKVNDMTDDSGNDFNEIGSGCFLSPQGGFL